MVRPLVHGALAVLLAAALVLPLPGCLKIGAEPRSLAQGVKMPTLNPAPKPDAHRPEGLKALLTGRSRITVTWPDEYRNARGYIIERSDGREFREIARVEKGMTKFDDIMLSPSTTYVYRICAYNASGTSGYSKAVSVTTTALSGPVVIDHTCTDLQAVPVRWIKAARGALHIAYGHSGPGSQLTEGMAGLAEFRGDLYAFGQKGAKGRSLDLRDMPFKTARDLSTPDRTTWAQETRAYLERHPEVNVVVWAWGEKPGSTERDIELYLTLMEKLEGECPSVMFVYMTAPLDGTGLEGNLHLRNEQIRDFCRSKGKILYDFEDIESYDPDGTYYGTRYPSSSCDYDSDMDGRPDANWAVSWQEGHPEGQDWFACASPLTKPVNANLKAHASWWLWARLAGWDEG